MDVSKAFSRAYKANILKSILSYPSYIVNNLFDYFYKLSIAETWANTFLEIPNYLLKVFGRV